MTFLRSAMCSLLIALAFAASLEAQLGDRPSLPPGHPDLTKGEGPDAAETDGYWFLHCGETKGWVYTPEHPKDPSKARQILLTKVPATSPMRNDLKVGDVILGVNGQYFTRNAVKQFRQQSVPAKKAQGTLDIILWRKGWDKERVVTVSLALSPLDFTKGDKPGPETDWNLGPTGARGYMQGFDNESRLTRQILVTSVHAGSPADGVLQRGDVILGVEGEKFSSDARKAFVAAVNRAETEKGGGQLSVKRWREGETSDVIIAIEIMGSYSETTPWDCPKNEKLLDNAVDYLVKHDLLNSYRLIDGKTSVTALALLSTGEEKYIELAKPRIYELADSIVASDGKPPKWGYDIWGWSYANMMLCEYHLLTGDDYVLPAIRKLSTYLADGQSGAGSWTHGSAVPPNRQPLGYGALNQVGNIAWLSLALAKRCGIDDPKVIAAIERGKAFLDAFIDTRTVPYGDGLKLDCVRHDDNGKNSSAAVAYGILGDERGTKYFSRMVVASYEHREFGHTGVWWSFLWGPLAAARAGQPATTAYLNEMGWLHDLERRWDGGFVYQGKMNVGGGLNDKGKQKWVTEHTTPHWDTTACRILKFTLPRKQLYITGKGLIVPVPKDQVSTMIEAGRAPATGRKDFGSRYEDRSVDQLLDLLGNWSPMVRTHAAKTLARRDNPEQYVPRLLAMLEHSNRYARYGACMALRHMKAGTDQVVDTLLPLLESDDVVLARQAIGALGMSANTRAIEPLLNVAATRYPEDFNQVRNRTAAQALFAKGGVLNESIESVDRDLLYSATRNLLTCKSGRARNYAVQGVIARLSRDELELFWPQVAEVMIDYPLTDVVAGSKARITIAQTIAKHKLEDGPNYILQYMENMRGHDPKQRFRLITEAISSYGSDAKALLPELQSRLKFLKEDQKWDDPDLYPPSSIYDKRHIPLLEEMITAIEKANDKPDSDNN